MSTEISTNDLRNFFIQNYKTDKISIDDAEKLGIDVEKFEYANVVDDNYFDLDEITDAKELYAAFTAIVEKERNAADEAKDAEKEKAEQRKVKDKNGTGAP